MYKSKYPIIHTGYDTSKNVDVLTQPLVFNHRTVPAGFKTDFTSTFSLIRFLIPRYGRANIAAVFHDYDYFTHAQSRRDADRGYRNTMIECGVGKCNAWLRWIGLRVFGWWRYGGSVQAAINKSTLHK